MAVSLLSAVIFLTFLDSGFAGNVSINESLIHTGEESGWCLSRRCACILTYHVDCRNVGLGDLRVTMLPANFSKIRSLWLDYANLTELEANVFQKLRYLKRLSLPNNYLTELNHNLFSDLSSLKHLNLRNNCLVSPLHNDLFKPLSKLRTLNLDYNKLMTLDVKVIDPIANGIKELTLSNNPLVCDCTISMTAVMFQQKLIKSTATCAYPNAGESWDTYTSPGSCKSIPKPQGDLTCHKAPATVKEGTGKSSDSIPLPLVLVVSICGFLLLLCGGLLLHCWRRATGNRNSTLDRRINENKHYDDICAKDYYYYETVGAQPRYTSHMTSSTRENTPEIPKRPQKYLEVLGTPCQTKTHDDVGKVRNSVGDSDSYIEPENPTTDKEAPVDKLKASGGSVALTEVLNCSGDIPSATEENSLVSTKPLQGLSFSTNVKDEEKEGATSPLLSKATTSTTAVRFDKAETADYQHVQAQETEYPWNRQSFWKS